MREELIFCVLLVSFLLSPSCNIHFALMTLLFLLFVDLRSQFSEGFVNIYDSLQYLLRFSVLVENTLFSFLHLTQKLEIPENSLSFRIIPAILQIQCL